MTKQQSDQILKLIFAFAFVIFSFFFVLHAAHAEFYTQTFTTIETDNQDIGSAKFYAEVFTPNTTQNLGAIKYNFSTAVCQSNFTISIFQTDSPNTANASNHIATSTYTAQGDGSGNFNVTSTCNGANTDTKTYFNPTPIFVGQTYTAILDLAGATQSAGFAHGGTSTIFAKGCFTSSNGTTWSSCPVGTAKDFSFAKTTLATTTATYIEFSYPPSSTIADFHNWTVNYNAPFTEPSSTATLVVTYFKNGATSTASDFFYSAPTSTQVNVSFSKKNLLSTGAYTANVGLYKNFFSADGLVLFTDLVATNTVAFSISGSLPVETSGERCANQLFVINHPGLTGDLYLAGCEIIDFFLRPNTQGGFGTNQLRAGINAFRPVFPFSVVFGVYDLAASSTHDTSASSLTMFLPNGSSTATTSLTLISPTTMTVNNNNDFRDMVFHYEGILIWGGASLVMLGTVLHNKKGSRKKA